MTRTHSHHSNGQPTLTDLMVRFLATRSDAAAAAVEPAPGDVEPYEVAAGFRVEPRAAWTDAVFAVQPAAASTPPEWSGWVNQPSSAFGVALAAGNFPQRVKDLQPLLAKCDVRELRPSATAAATPGLSGLRHWLETEARKGTAHSLLLAAGVARALGDFDRAEQILTAARKHCSGHLLTVWENEQAALQWQRGNGDAALAAWMALPDSPSVSFNRGMALLFLGRSAEARTHLAQAIAGLPEASGWSALARLYLAIAEIHAGA